jgi:hypothetical protein
MSGGEDRPVGRCIGCRHDFATGPCGGCGAIPGPYDMPTLPLPWATVPCLVRCETAGGCDWDNPRVPCPQTWPLDASGESIPPEELQ